MGRSASEEPDSVAPRNVRKAKKRIPSSSNLEKTGSRMVNRHGHLPSSQSGTEKDSQMPWIDSQAGPDTNNSLEKEIVKKPGLVPRKKLAEKPVRRSATSKVLKSGTVDKKRSKSNNRKRNISDIGNRE